MEIQLPDSVFAHMLTRFARLWPGVKVGIVLFRASVIVVSGVCPQLWAQEKVSPGIVREWQLANKRLTLVDVRSAGAFQSKHIAGAINVPHDKVLNAKFSKDETLVLYCTGEGCLLSPEAGAELVQKGYKKVFVLTGGIAEWEARGYPIVPIKPATPARTIQAGRVSPRDLHGRIKKGEEQILDVRPASEFSSGHLPGAINVPLEALEARLGSLNKTRQVVIYDRIPERSRKAGELLLQKGFTAQEMAGGIAVWIAMKLPVEM